VVISYGFTAASWVAMASIRMMHGRHRTAITEGITGGITESITMVIIVRNSFTLNSIIHSAMW